jgi:hypothetical protein
MGFIFRKSTTLKGGTRVNYSKTGLSASKKFGPLIVSSRVGSRYGSARA